MVLLTNFKSTKKQTVINIHRKISLNKVLQNLQNTKLSCRSQTDQNYLNRCVALELSEINYVGQLTYFFLLFYNHTNFACKCPISAMERTTKFNLIEIKIYLSTSIKPLPISRKYTQQIFNQRNFDINNQINH